MNHAARSEELHRYQRATYARPARSPLEALRRIQVGPFSGLHLAVAVLILILVLVGFGVSSVMKMASSESASTNTTTQQTMPSPEDTTLTAEQQEAAERQKLLQSINANYLVNVLGSDYADAMVETAQVSNDMAWIAANAAAYDWDGPEVQAKVLKLAVNDPLALQYVKDWPGKYPSDPVISRSYPASATGTSSVPLLFQWDQRWGYVTYSSAPFGLTGCCPTSFCMAYQGLTGKTDLSPADFGYMARTHGYMDTYNGTDSNFLINDAPEVGLVCRKILTEAYALQVSLESGALVVCNVGAGDFTTDGHFIVITGYDAAGDLTINDPYSSVRSAQTWDVQRVLDQTRGLYALWVA